MGCCRRCLLHRREIQWAERRADLVLGRLVGEGGDRPCRLLACDVILLVEQSDQEEHQQSELEAAGAGEPQNSLSSAVALE